jgi:four helix bundle protein
MKFKSVEDMKLWQSAMDFWRSINGILDYPGFLRDRSLRDQLDDAADSIVSNIEEGFEQPTDRAFARYLFISKASTAEARGRLKRAYERKYISAEELRTRDEIGDEVTRLTVGMIKYLPKSNRRDRGLGVESGNEGCSSDNRS